jgi:lipopolysaccharide transport system permease protein
MLRDISVRYKQSFLGILWAFLAPLTMMFVFVWIKEKNILPIHDTRMPYPAFVFLGQMVWLVFAHGVNVTANSLVAAGSMLKKINFPKEVLVVSAVGQTIFEFLLRLPLLYIVFIWVDFMPQAALFAMPVILLPLLLLVVGIGFYVSLLNAVFRDMSNLIVIILNLGLLVTPVIYPPPTTWPISFWVNYINPVSSFVIAVRDLATVGFITEPASLALSSALSILFFLSGWRLMHLVEPKIAERI